MEEDMVTFIFLMLGVVVGGTILLPEQVVEKVVAYDNFLMLYLFTFLPVAVVFMTAAWQSWRRRQRQPEEIVVCKRIRPGEDLRKLAMEMGGRGPIKPQERQQWAPDDSALLARIRNRLIAKCAIPFRKGMLRIVNPRAVPDGAQ